ncbi:MAG: 5-methylcytosine restriction system specificity protein McrC [Telluria sp.]
MKPPRLVARDCSLIGPVPRAVAEWLGRLARAVKAGDLVIALSGRRDDDDPVVECDPDGSWRAGRYIGTIAFEDGTLTILPRLGLPVILDWLADINSLVITPSPGTLGEHDNFIARLLAVVWASAFAEAARHGLPALRREAHTHGSTVRGRLDVRGTVALRACGASAVASVRSERSLEHAVSEVIVAAYSALRRELNMPDNKWLPRRAAELMPQLVAVAGAHPRVPGKAELARIRYTPITAGFGPLAELSRQIATRQGLAANGGGGMSHGVLLDVAELWELHVLHTLRKSCAPLSVRHGTREADTTGKMLSSVVDGSPLGTLIPDALLFEGEQVRAVIDAKYKRIHAGPQREDLYQLAAYLGRFCAPGRPALGALVYPADPEQPHVAKVEKLSPWRFDAGKSMWFVALPLANDAAAARCEQLLQGMQLNGGGTHSSG